MPECAMIGVLGIDRFDPQSPNIPTGFQPLAGGRARTTGILWWVEDEFIMRDLARVALKLR